MNSRDAFPTPQDWESLLWKVTVGGIGVAFVLVILCALMRFIFLIGILYGLTVVVLVFVIAQSAMRIEFEEPADPIEEASALSFPFAFVGRYPQLILLFIVGIATALIAPTVAALTGNLPGFSTSASADGGDSHPNLGLRGEVFPGRNQFVEPGTLTVDSVTTSSDWTFNHTAAAAFDGDLRSFWNSGQPPPGWLEADFGKSVTLEQVRMKLYAAPPGDEVHEVWISDKPIGHTAEGATLACTFRTFFRGGDVLQVTFPKGTKVRYVQLRTTISDSWPSWYEIAFDGN